MQHVIVIALVCSLLLSPLACVSAEKHAAMDYQMARDSTANSEEVAAARTRAEAAVLGAAAAEQAKPPAPPPGDAAAPANAAAQRVIITAAYCTWSSLTSPRLRRR